MMLSDYGKHTQLNIIDKDNDGEDTQRIFPINTADDVYVNENGNKLSQFLPTVKDKDGEGALKIEDTGEVIEVSDELAKKLMSSN